MTIQEKAAKALEESRTLGAERQAVRVLKNTALVTAAVLNVFGEGYDTYVNDMDVRIDGLSLQARIEYSRVQAFRLWGECPECGQKVWSSPFKDLAKLGELLEGFESSYEHKRVCAYRVSSPSSTDRLVDALRDFIAEIIGGNEP